MKRWLWVTLIGIIFAGWFIFNLWQEHSRYEVLKRIMSSETHIDTISVTDRKANEELLTFTESDAAFTPMIEMYRYPYVQLERPDHKILKEEPLFDIEYKQENEVKYVVRVHQLDSIPALETQLENRYIYSPENNNKFYIFGVKENDQLLVVNEGFQSLLDKLISK
ncbi:histone acetyltransferase [Solibacillus sp. FSL W7-1324]|uniref:histone acetyltransferase n=1 Tax=Solibacillus sp. FSL W7-1324 TaxID=2921701 RepID=UPI0030F743A2